MCVFVWRYKTDAGIYLIMKHSAFQKGTKKLNGKCKKHANQQSQESMQMKRQK